MNTPLLMPALVTTTSTLPCGEKATAVLKAASCESQSTTLVLMNLAL